MYVIFFEISDMNGKCGELMWLIELHYYSDPLDWLLGWYKPSKPT